jgi:hypothetical protein
MTGLLDNQMPRLNGMIRRSSVDSQNITLSELMGPPSAPEPLSNQYARLNLNQDYKATRPKTGLLYDRDFITSKSTSANSNQMNFIMKTISSQFPGSATLL